MKLECPVVRDLYTLYIENELSADVRDAVEQHLSECSGCRKIYEDGSGFDDILKRDEEKQFPKKMDEKLMMKLKVSRLRAGIIFIAAVFLVFLYYNYSQSRYNLLYDISQSENTLYKLSYKIDDVKNIDSQVTGFTEEIQSINDQQNNAIMRDLNFIEKSRLDGSRSELFMDFHVSYLYTMLKTRYKNGTFTERDEKAFSLLKQYMEDIAKLTSDERNSLNRLHDGGKFAELVRPINVGAIAGGYTKINQLSLIYYQYSRFPDEISPMTKEQLTERISYIYSTDKANVKLSPNIMPSIMLNGDCDYDVEIDGLYYHGSIDAYTGNLNDFLCTTNETQGELLPIDGVTDNLSDFLKRVYGDKQQFDIQHMGINYNFTSNTDIKLYSYRVCPVIGGINVDNPVLIYYNARTGYIYNMTKISGQGFTVPDYDVDTSINITPDAGAKLIEDDSKKYYYSKTVIIKSILTGKYAPVHVYESDTGKAYINTVTGKQDYSY